ncbi:7TM receptor with intracellular metal dependent phosphohydrolase [Cellulophaga algicola DSM 14237]|uniref:7TM receptor with intracellular metal dependent phosphohydrolase n=1 Tax=Cellulophaga algicola (strain DSM 14237 / IC166 / ACAM 630) TaxID=688270 RepID=E6XEC1_CELAD|nr:MULTISPECIES: HDIG domain-containing metalloprotein [Cellulophaga]ADV50211.1 7TM receptor with intracellular metal dependent phosphohydrolase [Cellulophaga algicola DSM 14237]
MSTFLDNLYKNQSLVYKYFIYILSTVLIVFFFPKGGKFKYEFQKGKPWQYDNYYAPVDFSIKKSDDEIEKEKTAIKNRQIPYYSYDKEIVNGVYGAYSSEFKRLLDGLAEMPNNKDQLYGVGENILNILYNKGVANDVAIKSTSNSLNLIKNNEEIRINSNQLFTKEDLDSVISIVLKKNNVSNLNTEYQRLFFDIVEPNVFYDGELSKKVLEDAYSRLSYTRGTVDQGKLIIAKGEVVESENYKILSSLKSEYESELWTSNNYYFILFGYSVLVALVLMMLLLFLKKYRKDIYRNNTKVTFIFFNILFMVFVTTLVVKYNEAYVFVVPLCILPLILKTFFDARLGLFVHVLTVLILGFVVPNSFEYIFLQIITGIVTILTVSELYKRANLFISVGQIILIYIVGYFAFHIIHEGNLDNVQWLVFGLFLLNGMITLFVQPLIYIYEKAFGLVSDVSLLELSDTNSKLLKELSNKAPGTFHHSLQVANLAEAAANEIGANAMLVRVGALYHDIGKMNNPTYFTENQITNVNPHDELAPKDSAKIIIDHVIGGIELARKNNLPDRIIDFIRVHHGTSLVYYFYKKQQEIDEHVNEQDFRYPGPTPFSKETAILMMADSIEAASKSLKNPTFLIIDEFVNKIISGQMNANQFLNANITFKEIEAIKKVMKQKLTNIYHLRVEYPE